MTRYAQFKTFAIVFGVAYTLCFYLNSVYPMSAWFAPIRYYPSIAEWHLERQPPETAGPAILWYAWLAEAFVFSVVVSLLVPRKVADRLPHSSVWMVPALLIVAILVYERRWFF